MSLAGVSGRVDTLETNVSFLQQDNLRNISIETLGEYSIVWNQQITSIETSVLAMQAQLKTLQTLYTSMFMTVQNNFATFTGHTGLNITGSLPLAHSGSS